MSGASLDIQLQIANAAEVSAAFQSLQNRLADLTPVFRDIGEAMLNSTRERFNTQTAPDGTPWAALSKKYKASKPVNKDKILTLYGRLRGTLTYRAGPKEVRIGSPLDYAGKHQFGDPQIHLRKRPFLGLSVSDETELLDILNDHLSRAMAGRG